MWKPASISGKIKSHLILYDITQFFVRLKHTEFSMTSYNFMYDIITPVFV